MSDKIVLSANDVSRLNGAFDVDDFRAMVNYESGKNKGYVRLTKKADGTFGVEKINNKIDILVNSRTNVNAANNRALREAFAATLARGMYGASDAQKASVLKIAQALGVDDPHVRETPLSRREIRAALAAYDRVMNSPSARVGIVNSLITDALKNAKIEMDKFDFMSKYMKMDIDLYDGEFNEYFRKFDAGTEEYKNWAKTQSGKDALYNDIETFDTHGARAAEPMMKGDIAFVNFLHQCIDRRISDGIDRYRLEVELHEAADAVRNGVLSPNDVFAGDELSDGFKTLLEKAIASKLKLDGIDVDKGTGEIGSHRTVLNAFMKQIVPALVRQARHDFEMTKPEGDESVEARNERIDTFLSLDQICDHAKTFFARVDEALNLPQDEFDRQMDNIAKNSLGTATYCRARGEIAKHTKASVAERDNIAAEIRNEADSVTIEAKIQLTAEKYIKDVCGDVVIAGELAAKGLSEITEERINDVVLAVKLNIGERWAVDGDRYLQDKPVKDFLSKASDLIKRYVNVNHGGLEMYTKLMEVTLPKYVNAHIEHERSWGTDTRLKLGGTNGNDDELMDFVAGAADAYVNFTRDVQAEMKSAYKAFSKILEKMVKKGTITAAAQNYLLDTVLTNALKENSESSLRILLSQTTARLKEDETLGNRIARAVKRTVQRGLKAAYHELSLCANNPKFETDYLAKTEKYRNAVEKRCEEVHAEFYDRVKTVQMEMSKDPGNVLGAQVAGLDKRDREAFVETVTKEVVSRLKGEVDERLLAYRDDPEVYKSNDAVAELLKPIYEGTDRGSATYALNVVLQDRADAYQRWMGRTAEDRKNTMDGICAGVVTELQAVAPQLPREVIARLAKAPNDALFAKVEAHVAFYAQVDGEKATKDKIAAELRNEVMARLTPFAKTCGQFLAEVEKLAAEHAGVTKEERDEVVRYTLTLAAGSKDPASLKLKNLRQLFHKGMNDKLMKKVSVIYANFEDFVARMDKAEKGLEQVKAHYAQVFDEESKGLPDAVIAHFREVTLRRYEDKLNTILCTEPEKFFDGNVASMKGQVAKEAFASAFAAKYYNALDSESFDNLLNEAGLGLYVDNKEKYAAEYAEMRDNLVKYSQGEDNRKTVEALLCRIIDGDYEAAEKELVNEVRDYAAPVAGRLHLAAFNGMELEPALKLFDTWVENYGEMGFKGILDVDLGGGKTLRKLAHEMFIGHYNDIANHIVMNEENEPLLSQGLVNKLVALFGTTGVTVAKRHLLENLSAESMIAGNERLDGMIKMLRGGDLAQLEVDRYYLRLSDVIHDVRKRVDFDFNLNMESGFENYARCEKEVEKKFNEIVESCTHDLSLSFQRHFGMALTVERAYGAAKVEFLDRISAIQEKLVTAGKQDLIVGADKLFQQMKDTFNSLALDTGKIIMGEIDADTYKGDGEKRLHGMVDGFFEIMKSNKSDLAKDYRAFVKTAKKNGVKL